MAKTNVASEKIRIRLKAYDHVVLEQSAEKIVDTAKKTGAKVSGPIPLPTEKEIVTILRSPHKHKDSREQFEMRTHKRVIDILYPTQKTMDSLKKECSFVINIGSRIYPLNEVLINNFAEKYEISKGKDRLSGKSGLKNNTKEGETFYRIKKS